MNAKQMQDLLNGSRPWDSVSDEDWQAVGDHLTQLDDAGDSPDPVDAFDDLDREISAAMLAVEPPADLRGSLLAACGFSADANGTETKPLSETVPSGRVSASESRTRSTLRLARRGFLGAAVCGLIAAICWLSEPEVERLWSLTDLKQSLVGVEDFSVLPVANEPVGQSSAVLREWQLVRRLQFDPPREFTPEDSSVPVGTVYPFAADLRNGPVNGFLYVIPTADLAESVPDSFFTADHPTYLQAEGKIFVAHTWAQDDLTFVCVLERNRGASDPLRDLQLVLRGQLA